ncbi:hypothetical protein Tco_0127513 [Tanacetum coccineum]
MLVFSNALLLFPRHRPFNLAYYMAKRMVGVIKNDVIVLPYGMFLTRLYRHVSTIQPCPLTDNLSSQPTHDMVPFHRRDGKKSRIPFAAKGGSLIKMDSVDPDPQ